MAFRVGLLFLALICVIGLGWLLGGEEEPRSTLQDAAEPTEPTGEAPSLTTVDRPENERAAAAPVAARPLPSWIDHRRALGDAKTRARLVTWIQDPANLDDYIADIVRKTSQWDVHAAFQHAQMRFAPFGGIRETLMPMVSARITQEPPPRYRAALLGAAFGIGGVRLAHNDLLAIVRNEHETTAMQVVAARALLQRGADVPIASIEAVLRRLADQPTVELQVLLRAIRDTLAGNAKPLVPFLFELRTQLDGVDWGSELILQIAAKADPTNPDAQPLFVAALGHPKPLVRAAAFEALSKSDTKDLARALRSATASAQLMGARLLLRKGAPREEVAPLLLSALTHGGYTVREDAIKLLPRVTPDVRATLPIIEGLLGGKDKAMWLSGTRALGALTTSAGERDDIMHLLFTAARLPDPKVRVTAVQSLLMFDRHAEKVIPVLVDLLQDSETQVRREAVDGLGELSAHHEAAKAPLRMALGDADESVRKLATYWLELDDDD